MKLTNACILSVPFLLAGVILSQEPNKSKQETTVSGCLNKGAGDAQYVLTDQTTGNKTPVTGTSDLAQHTTHTVKLTGSSTIEKGQSVFTATKVEHVSATCTAPTDKK